MRVFGTIMAVLLGIVAMFSVTWMSTYNGFQRKDQSVQAAERKIASCYQKRADLIGNLEATVSQYATHEKSTLTEITQSRAGAGQVKLPENATPEQLKEFAEAQKANTSALSRLLAISENYPNLKANVNFLSLQKDLKQVENQCNILRNKYIEEIKLYNTSIHTFPSNIIAGVHGMSKKEQLKFDDEKENKKSPRVFKK